MIVINIPQRFWRYMMINRTISKFYTINTTTIKLAFILALLLMSFLVPEIVLAVSPSHGGTGG